MRRVDVLVREEDRSRIAVRVDDLERPFGEALRQRGRLRRALAAAALVRLRRPEALRGPPEKLAGDLRAQLGEHAARLDGQGVLRRDGGFELLDRLEGAGRELVV